MEADTSPHAAVVIQAEDDSDLDQSVSGRDDELGWVQGTTCRLCWW